MLRLLILFFFSGCAALIYETVWFYLVQLVVGASSISVAVLLCAFMGGMAIGSWLLMKLTPRASHPFRVVAALEIGIAIFGVAIPLALPYIQRLYLTLAEPGAGAVTLRAVVCFIVLTPPTMLMGATLPAIAAAFARTSAAQARDASAVGMLYTANLAGAASGTVLAGFYLLRVHDTVVATAVAVSLNVVVAAAFWRMASATVLEAPEASAAPDPSAASRARHAPPAVYVAAALAGFTALGAEVVWTRQLSLLFGASVYTFSLILAVFLTGLGLGGLLGARLARRAPDPRSVLGVVHVALAVAIGFGAWAIVNVLPGWQPTAQFLPSVRATPSLAFAFDTLRSAFALLPAAILWGASFPLTLACGSRDFAAYVARINAINTGGALAGAIAFTLIGIPLLGSHASQQALVAFAAISGTALLWNAANGSRSRRVAITAAIGAATMWIVPPVPGT